MVKSVDSTINVSEFDGGLVQLTYDSVLGKFSRSKSEILSFWAEVME